MKWIGIAFALAAASGALPAQDEVARAAPLTRLAQPDWNAAKKSVRLPNGIELAYLELGDPSGPPVVLLHGYTDTSRVWSILAPQLGRNRLLIPDQRGHGASSKPECCYAPADFAYDVRLFMDALGIERAALVGSSMGSMVAQLFAAEYPERTRGIVLAGSTARPPLERNHWLYPVVTDRAAPANRNAAFLREWSPAASPTPVDSEFVRYFDREMSDVPTHVWRAVIRELTGFPIARHAADVRAPVLILSGGKDPLFGADHHASLLQAYPAARSRVFAELGHNLVVERPQEVGPVLAAFLDGLSR